MAMNNSLAEVHPELVSEWSEKNLPLKPDEVNAKSRKNVWWRCSKCGNEWKSVINARVKVRYAPFVRREKFLPDIMIWRQQTVSFSVNGIMKRINGSRQRYHELQQRECGGNAGTVIHWCVFCLPFL